MKNLFLTSGLVLCMVGSAFAATDINSSGSNASCVNDVLGTYSGSASFNAKWVNNASADINLDSNRWTSNTATSAASTASTPAAPTPIYSVYDVGMYSDSGHTTAITAITTAPVMTGYNFAGFYTEKATGGTLVINTDKTFTSGAKNVVATDGGSATWYARWTPINYTVTFDKNSKDANGTDLVNQAGTAVGPTGTAPTSQVYAYDSTANLTSNGYSVAGYSFGGWKSNHDLTTVAGTGTPTYGNGASITYKYPGNATLTAIWNPVKSGAIGLVSSVYPSNNRASTATYTIETTESVTNPTTTTVYTRYNTGMYSDADATIAVSAANLKPSKSGYTFGGFYNSAGTTQYINASGNPTDAGKRAVQTATTDTWYANWSPIEYSITYKPGTAGTRTVQGNNQTKAVYYDGTTYKDGSALNTMAANTFSITGYSFSGWSSNKNVSTGATATTPYGAATGLAKYKVVGHTEMTAQWTPNCYGAVVLDNNKYNSTTPTETDYTVNGSSIYVKYDNGWYTASGCENAATVSKPSLTGYTFGGYYTDKNGAGTPMANATPAITDSGKTITSAQTWYAKWTPNDIGITYTCGDLPTVTGLTIGSTGSASSPTTVTFDTPYTIASTNGCSLTGDRGGYHFGGWSCSVDPDDNSGTATYESTQSSNVWTVSHTVSKWKAATDVTCKAIWTGNTYHVSYAHGTAGARETGFSGDMSAGADVRFGQNYTVAANNFSIPGYEFAGWKGNYSNDTGEATINGTTYGSTYSFAPYKIAHDITLTAQWTPMVYSVTLQNYNNTATESTIYEKYDNGWFSDSSATLSISVANVPTRAGYKFRGYYSSQQADLTESGGSGTRVIDKDGALPAHTTYTANATLYSAWAKECTSPAHGTCSTTVNNDGTVTYTASCDTGYTVSGATTATPSCTANSYAVTYSCGGKPGSEDLTCSGTAPCTATAPTSDSFTYDSGYELPDNAGTCQYKGWSFDGWKCDHVLTNGNATAGYTGDNNVGTEYTGGATGTFKVAGAVACKAKWKANNIGITWSYGNGSANTSGTCDYDGLISVPDAPTKTGYTFTGWTISNN